MLVEDIGTVDPFDEAALEADKRIRDAVWAFSVEDVEDNAFVLDTAADEVKAELSTADESVKGVVEDAFPLEEIVVRLIELALDAAAEEVGDAISKKDIAVEEITLLLDTAAVEVENA